MAFLPLVVLIALLAANLTVFGDGGLDGPNQLALLLAGAVAVVIGLAHGRTFNGLLQHIVDSITTALGAFEPALPPPARDVLRGL